MSVEGGLRALAGLLVWLTAASAAAAGGAAGGAASPVPPAATAQAAHQVASGAGLSGGGDLWSRLLPDEPSPVRSLDPAIFLELSPVTASDPAVRLPDDQREPDWGTSADGKGAR